MKLTSICVIATLVVSSTALAQGRGDGPPKSGEADRSGYIHRPDSTQYHPGGNAAEAADAAPAVRDGWRHRPDSTQYRPGGRDEGDKAAGRSGYVHVPDSTMYHPGGGSAAPAGRSGYIHKPDSTMYHPGGDGLAPDSRSGYIHKPDSTMYHPGGDPDEAAPATRDDRTNRGRPPKSAADAG